MYSLTKYYPCYGRPFSRDLGEVIKICEADCDTEIVETVWDYAEAMLRLWYGVVGYAGSRLYWETEAMDWEK